MENQDRHLYLQNKSARTVGDPVALRGDYTHISADLACLRCEMWISATPHTTHVSASERTGVGVLMALTADNHGQTLIEGSHWCRAADGHFGPDERR